MGKRQCWIIFLIQLQAWRPATLLKRDFNTSEISCGICDIFKKTFFYRTHQVAASEQTQETSVINFVADSCSGHLAQVYLSYPISS